MRGYRDLEVWQVAMTLVEEVFAVCRRLPDDQRFGLVSQLQRAAVSVPSNIAEGHAKRSGKDYQRHLRIAAGSLAELETQLELRAAALRHARRRSPCVERRATRSPNALTIDPQRQLPHPSNAERRIPERRRLVSWR